MAESEEELKKPLDESERGEWKSWLKAQHSENEDHGIRFHYFMGNRWGNSGKNVSDFIFLGSKINASGPITQWEIDGETVETVSDFTFGVPKSLQKMIAAMKLKDAYSLGEKLWPTKIAIQKQRHYFAD